MKNETFLVVLGLDTDQKPRAAKFDLADEKIVRKAAAAQGLKIGRPKTDEATELAIRLVDGKIFASGKGLMPLVNSETYQRLLQALEIEDPKADTITVKPSHTATASNDLWAKITVGTIVLVQDDSAKPKERGWFECSVSGISKDSKLLTVRWTNFPTIKPFTVKRAAVAILPAKS